jgi:hypothetical protein
MIMEVRLTNSRRASTRKLENDTSESTKTKRQTLATAEDLEYQHANIIQGETGLSVRMSVPQRESFLVAMAQLIMHIRAKKQDIICHLHLILHIPAKKNIFHLSIP